MKRSTFLVIASLVFVIHSNAGRIRYVTELGSGFQNGVGWINAFPGTYLQVAINASQPGDEVWVACGVYLPTTSLNRRLSFILKNGVAVYGGFQAYEFSVDQRDLSCGPCSVLSGEIGDPSTIADNSLHVIVNTNSRPDAVLDGFVITAGNADGPAGFIDGRGGGILNNGAGQGSTCAPTIRNCIIRNNTARQGGGVFNDGSTFGDASPTFEHCIFFENSAVDGAGMFFWSDALGSVEPLIINCLFVGNVAANAGGGLAFRQRGNGKDRGDIRNCIFTGNIVTAGVGGGLYAETLAAHLTMVNTIAWGNKAEYGKNEFALQEATLVGKNNIWDGTNSDGFSGPSEANKSVDPLFVDINNPAGPDGCWRTIDDGLQLQPASPAIDAGINSLNLEVDLLNNDRVHNGVVDIGAYEYDASAIVGIEDPLKNNSAYPNPVGETLTVVASRPTEFSITDVAGKVISRFRVSKAGESQISVQSLKPGIYVLRDERTAVMRILKK